MKKPGVIAFGFAINENADSSKRISRLAASESAKLGGCRVFTQLGILIDDGTPVTYMDKVPGHPPPTLRIARATVAWAKENGIDKLIIVCARPHLWRCYRDMNLALEEAHEILSMQVSDGIVPTTEESWFCADSGQFATSSEWRWLLYDTTLQLMPIWLYKLIAK